MIAALLLGFAMGFVSAIPVAGPVSAMVVERALARRYFAALMVAVGTAVAEGVYAALAVLGFAAIAEHAWVGLAAKGVAGAILVAVGLLFALRPPKPPTKENAASAEPMATSWRRQWLIGFAITIANPALLATWAAVTSMVAASGWVTLTSLTALPFGLAVAAGVAAWFALLIAIVKRFTRGIRPESIAKVIRIIGWALVALGVWFLVQLIIALV